MTPTKQILDVVVNETKKMVKLYKRDNKKELLYAEYWITDKEITVHTGKVGREGRVKEYYLNKDFETEGDFVSFFRKKFESQGYSEILDEEICFLAVQFPMKSLKGNKRDYWLRDKVTEYLNEELGWAGLGHIDGFDMGELISFPQKYALTIFCIVVDEAKGIKIIKRCLRYSDLDYDKVKIASRPYLSDIGFQLKYSAKKDDFFSI